MSDRPRTPPPDPTAVCPHCGALLENIKCKQVCPRCRVLVANCSGD